MVHSAGRSCFSFSPTENYKKSTSTYFPSINITLSYLNFPSSSSLSYTHAQKGKKKQAWKSNFLIKEFKPIFHFRLFQLPLYRMAMEQNFFEQESYFESDGDISLKHKWNSISEPTKDLENDSGCFDCSICFEPAKDPVVTLCGHLYCWPCIYKWLHVRASSPDADPKQKNCPVCKANISSGSLVPLYGHGTSSKSQSKNPHSDMFIPQRPPPSTSNITTAPSHLNRQLHENFYHSQSQAFHNQQYLPHPYGGYTTLASSDLGGIAMTNVFHPMIRMLGEMVHARMFGSSNTSMVAYTNQASYPFSRNNNLRLRRQEIKVDKSLSRVSMFLLCCIILCLLLF